MKHPSNTGHAPGTDGLTIVQGIVCIPDACFLDSVAVKMFSGTGGSKTPAFRDLKPLPAPGKHPVFPAMRNLLKSAASPDGNSKPIENNGDPTGEEPPVAHDQSACSC
jgi:hypothetical protein